MIYEFKITLDEAGIPIWRTIQMDENASFFDLHRVIQVVFDWDDYHLHSFSVQRSNGKRVEEIYIESRHQSGESFGWDGETYNESQEHLSNWFKIQHDKMLYTYDFGDDWRHDVVLSKIMQPEKGVLYPRCIAAEYVAPEEDSGFQAEIDLNHPHPELQVKEINDNIHQYLSGMLAEIPMDVNNHWEKVLSKAKKFHHLHPWKWMDDRHIFAVVDPVTKERLFCSVLGADSETFGLAIYIGKNGYRTLEHILDESAEYDEIAMNQRCLLPGFKDRQNLNKGDYALIKTYGISFRGKKAWPQFRSFVPGYAPWFLDDDESRMMSIVLEQAIQVSRDIRDGMQVPDVSEKNKVFARVPRSHDGKITFENQVLDLDGYLADEPQEEIELAVGELALKCVRKLTRKLPVNLEFSFEYMHFPVAENQHERPFFPMMAIALDHDSGLAVYQNMFEKIPDPADYQGEMLNMLQQLGSFA